MILFYTLNALAFLLFVFVLVISFLFYKQDKEIEQRNYSKEVDYILDRSFKKTYQPTS